jgi:hypothetical protein
MGGGAGGSVFAELRAELLREARFNLGTWERDRDDLEARGRLLQVLDDLALLIRAGDGF